jgi:hypothetical protein
MRSRLKTKPLEITSKEIGEIGSSGVQEFRSSGVQEFRSSGVQEFRSSGWGGEENCKARPSTAGLGYSLATPLCSRS